MTVGVDLEFARIHYFRDHGLSLAVIPSRESETEVVIGCSWLHPGVRAANGEWLVPPDQFSRFSARCRAIGRAVKQRPEKSTNLKPRWRIATAAQVKRLIKALREGGPEHRDAAHWVENVAHIQTAD
jgi:hypothetical protein